MPVLEPGCGGAVATPSPGVLLSALPTFTVKRNTGPILYIRTPWDEASDIVQKVEITLGQSATDNDEVRLREAKLIPIATANTAMDTAFNASSDTLAQRGDDIPPSQFNGHRMTAAHGPLITNNVTVASHSLTAEDVGSIWADAGAKQWTLVAILSATSLRFMPENTGASATSWAFNTTMGASPLTHVSGATHTGDIAFSAPTQTQQKPCSNAQVKTVVMDGTPITANGVYTGRDLRVYETYSIPNQASALAFVQANVGSATAPALNDASIAVQATVSNVHRWLPNGSYTIEQRVTFVQAAGTVGQTIQAATQGGFLLTPSGGSLWLYVPKMAPWTGAVAYDLTNAPMDITAALSEQIDLSPDRWVSASDAPDRIVYFTKTSGGAIESASFVGKSTRRGFGVPSVAPGVLAKAGYISTSTAKKAYIHALEEAAGTGTAGEVWWSMGWQQVSNAANCPNATAFGWYMDGQYPIVVADFHQAVTAEPLQLPTGWAGAGVEVLDTDGTASVGARVVSATGTVPVTVTGTYGSVKLRIVPRAGM